MLAPLKPLLGYTGWLASAVTLFGADVRVASPAELRDAVAAARPGTRIVMAGGDYGGGFQFPNLRGAPGQPIILAAADRNNPPVFRAARVGMHLSRPAYVELHDLVFTKISGNGVNIDDGGAPAGGRRASRRAARAAHQRYWRNRQSGRHKALRAVGLSGRRLHD